MFFVSFITFAMPRNAGEDPLIKREEDAVGEVTTWIKSQLAVVTRNGRKTAPTISTLLEPLESSLGPRNRNEKDPYSVWDIKRKEIDRLKALYVDWEPIYKWQGEGGDSDAGAGQ